MPSSTPQTNPDTTTTVVNQTQYPQWFLDALQGTQPTTDPTTGQTTGGTPGLLPMAFSTAQSGTPYPNQQIAGLTPDQLAAAGVIENQAAPNQTDLAAANAYTTNAGTINPGEYAADVINPALQQSSGLVNQGLQTAQNITSGGLGFDQQAGNLAAGLGYSAVPTYQSGLGATQQGLGYAGQAAAGAYGGASSASPYLSAATSQSGLSAASPYLAGANTGWTQVANQYMSPYVTNANDALAQQYATNLSEFVLPQVSSQFVGLGQAASPQQANFESNLINQQMQSLGQQQAANLNQAYQSGASTYESDANRQAQLASTAGGLGSQQQQALLQAGLGLGGLTQSGDQSLLGAGQTAGQLGLGTGQLGLGAGQLGTSGLLGAGQATTSAGLGLGQLDASSGLGLGQLGVSAGSTLANAGNEFGQLQLQTGNQAANLSSLPQQQAIQQAAALNSVGTQAQTQNQNVLNTDFQNLLNQLMYPQEQVGFLSNVIHGLPVNTSTTGQSTSPATTSQLQPNSLAQLLGNAAGAAGTAGNFNLARGGVVKGSRRKASYGRGTSPGLGYLYAE